MRCIVLAVVLGTLFAGIAVYVSSGRRVSISGPPRENAEVATPNDAPPQRDAPVATTRGAGAPVHAPSPPLGENPAPQPPSAECLALRAEQESYKAELEALTPDALTKLIDTVARESLGREQDQQQGLKMCLALTDPTEKDQCLQALTEVLNPEMSASREASREAAEVGTSGLRAAVRQLAINADARTLIAATAMLPYGLDTSRAATDESYDRLRREQNRERATWLARAQTLAPDDVLVQWAVASRLGIVGRETPPELERAHRRAVAQLRRLDPGNAAVELLAMGTRRSGDGGEVLDLQSLAKLVAMSAYRQPLSELMNLVLDASERLQLTPETLRALRSTPADDSLSERVAFACTSNTEVVHGIALAMGSASVVQLDNMLEISSFCKGSEDGMEPGRQRNCLRLAELLYSNSALLVYEGIPIAIGKSLALAGADRDRWLARERRQRWQNQKYFERMVGETAMSQVRDSIAAWRSGDERQARERTLREAAIPLDPPDDWQPKS